MSENKDVKGIVFLNDNLSNHFRKRRNSLIGTEHRFDACGEEYKVYEYDVVPVPSLMLGEGNSDLNYCLQKMILEIERILSGLVESKQCEKPDGGKAGRRPVKIHWRRFPEVRFNDQKDRMIVSFRISLHHDTTARLEYARENIHE